MCVYAQIFLTEKQAVIFAKYQHCTKAKREEVKARK
jgi:hypothetical protein